jgi:hypothetical protein
LVAVGVVALSDLEHISLSFDRRERLAVPYLGPSSVASVDTNVVPFAGVLAGPAAVRLIVRFHYGILVPFLRRVALQDDMLVVFFASAGIQSRMDLLAHRNTLWSRGSKSYFPLLAGNKEQLVQNRNSLMVGLEVAGVPAQVQNCNTG